jgi:hypothetical protein
VLSLIDGILKTIKYFIVTLDSSSKIFCDASNRTTTENVHCLQIFAVCRQFRMVTMFAAESILTAGWCLCIVWRSCRWCETTSLNCGHKRAYCSSPRWYEHGEPWWSDIHKPPDSSPELPDYPTSSYLLANQDELGEGNDELGFRNNFVHTSEWFLTCRVILRYEVEGFTSALKEGVLRSIISLKNASPRPVLNSRTLGPVASTLTITPPRRL